MAGMACWAAVADGMGCSGPTKSGVRSQQSVILLLGLAVWLLNILSDNT
jgi:hypothetical protein